jgi:hypothetical protein
LSVIGFRFSIAEVAQNRHWIAENNELELRGTKTEPGSRFH